MQYIKLLSTKLSAIAIVLLLVGVPSLNSTGWAQGSSPDDFSSAGQPDSSSSGTSRGGCANTSKPLTLLAPTAAGKGGWTTQAYPTFWVYVPYKLTPEKSIVFVLRDDQNKAIYQTKIKGLEAPPGITSLTLPSTSAPLKKDKVYTWSFRVYCDKVADRPAFVSGWIKRIELEPSITSQLAQSPPQKQSQLYSSKLVWYDAFTVIGEELRKNPRNLPAKAEWNRLLTLPSVGLNDFSKEPLTQSLPISKTVQP